MRPLENAIVPALAEFFLHLRGGAMVLALAGKPRRPQKILEPTALRGPIGAVMKGRDK